MLLEIRQTRGDLNGYLEDSSNPPDYDHFTHRTPQRLEVDVHGLGGRVVVILDAGHGRELDERALDDLEGTSCAR
jgi:hypothetical protein